MRGGDRSIGFRSDHSFDHLQVRTTWEIWTLRHKKAPKSTQNEAKDGYCFLWDQDVAGSNPVIPTKFADLTAFCGQIGAS